ncbi:MAG: phage/plasmid primase, P4 family [Pseudomonadota bacterium]
MSQHSKAQPEAPATETMLDAALELARAGYAVFPLYPASATHKAPVGKRPRCWHGHNDATTDEAQIERWWSEPERGDPDAWQCSPDNNIGIAVPDGMVIIDLDPRNGGWETFDKVEAECGADWINTLTVDTGGGGKQFYLSCEPGRKFPPNLNAHFGPGIDLKQCGGFVVAPPSTHKSGGVYAWDPSTGDIEAAPAWLTLLSKVKANSDVAPAPEVPDGAELDDRMRAKLDQAIEAIEPFYVDGEKHYLALAIGGYLRNKSWPAVAAKYVVSQLPSEDYNGRIADAVWAWGPGVHHPRGAAELRERWIELLPLLDEIFKSAFKGRKTKGSDGAQWDRPAAETADSDQADQAKKPSDMRTDIGNARRLVRGHGDRIRYFEARKVWYVWDGARWKADNTGEIVRAAKEAAESLWEEAKEVADDEKQKAAFAWAAKCQDRQRLTNMIELAKSEPGIPVTAADLDAHPWLLNVQNGTLDLRTGELLEPDPALLMTKCCATHYEPGARSDLWEAFVKRTTGNDAELAAYIQRSLGYALFGAWREKAFWFGYGPPDGAKSTLLGVTGDVLGDYHVAAAASTWMVQNNVGGNRGDITRLLGARFVTSLEIRPGLRLDEELVKKVTGGDTIVAAGKYENDIQFQPTFALWMGANDRPTIRDDDEGTWSRVRCVPFTNPVPEHEKDRQLREKLTSAEHAPAVLAWLVAGCMAWQREGIGKCAAVTSATQAYRADMNRAGTFFEDCCELSPGHETSARAMRHAYDQWCKANSVRAPLAAKAFGQRLRALGATGGDDTSRRVVQPATKAVGSIAAQPAVMDRFWTGVRLVADAG